MKCCACIGLHHKNYHYRIQTNCCFNPLWHLIIKLIQSLVHLNKRPNKLSLRFIYSLVANISWCAHFLGFHLFERSKK